MKRVILQTTVLAVLVGAGANAQNSDLGILLGVSVRTSAIISPGRIESAYGASVQFNYAAQLRESAAGRLYLELPVLIAAESRSVLASSIKSNHSTTVFFTPGIRFHHTIHPRVALYAAVGGGIASLAARLSIVSPGAISSSNDRATSPALGFGGGLDFRVTRLISIRAEGRDFVTRAGLGGENGRNHPFFTVGVGFHF